MDNKNEKIVEYYSDSDEQGRLLDNWGQVEFVRTQSLIRRYLTKPPQSFSILVELQAGIRVGWPGLGMKSI